MSDLAARVEANISAFLIEMGAAGGGTQRDDDEIAWTIGGSPIGYHNAVVTCFAPSPTRASMLIDDWVAELDRRKLPGSWHLSPSMTPAELPDLLTRAGFQDGGEEPAMALHLDDLPDVPRGDAQLAIQVVERAADLDRYRAVLSDGFGEGPREADWVASVYANIGFARTGRWLHLIGCVGKDPAATATILVTGDVAGVYFVSTRPAFRRRGFGAAITHQAAQEAKQQGATLAVLGSSPMGQRVYEALGFRTVFNYRLFERDA